MYAMFSRSFRTFKNYIMEPYFKEMQSDDNQTYYIDPPTKFIIRKLIFIWVAVWLSFMITFSGHEIIMCFFWMPLGTALIYYVYTWKKFGFSSLMYFLLNLAVLSVGYGFSRIVHFVIGSLVNG